MKTVIIRPLIGTGLVRLRKQLGLGRDAMARALGLAPKTLARVEQRQGTSLPAVLDRLAALHHVVMVAEDVLGSRAAACEWLMRPHPLYKKTPPLLILDSYSGTVEVLRELERIAYGVMS